MESNTIEIFLTIMAMGFWILFPIGMFLSVSHIDKSTDKVVSLGRLPHDRLNEPLSRNRKQMFQKRSFHWHHPVLNFKRWLHH